MPCRRAQPSSTASGTTPRILAILVSSNCPNRQEQQCLGCRDTLDSPEATGTSLKGNNELDNYAPRAIFAGTAKLRVGILKSQQFEA